LIRQKSSEFINEIVEQAKSSKSAITVEEGYNSILNKFESQVEEKLAKMEQEFKMSLERLENKNQQSHQMAKFERESFAIMQELKA
jgi:flagellar biosynthesis/type III secretory pathway protein FliH